MLGASVLSAVHQIGINLDWLHRRLGEPGDVPDGRQDQRPGLRAGGQSETRGQKPGDKQKPGNRRDLPTTSATSALAEYNNLCYVNCHN